MIQNQYSEVEDKQRNYYNQIARVYDKHHSHPYSLKYRYQVFDGILKNLSLEGKFALDAMCGGGENSGYFLNRGALLSGVDISEKQCEIYQSRYPQCQVVCSSIFRTPFKPNTFDLVVTESLHHHPPYIFQGIQEMHRILKPGGIFLVWEPVSGSILDAARKLWYKLDRKYFQDNERSVDLIAISEAHKNQFKLLDCRYGGNLGFLLVQESMIFRIPTSLVSLYAPTFLMLEKWIQKIQTRLTACWVLGLLKKI